MPAGRKIYKNLFKKKTIKFFFVIFQLSYICTEINPQKVISKIYYGL